MMFPVSGNRLLDRVVEVCFGWPIYICICMYIYIWYDDDVLKHHLRILFLDGSSLISV